MRLRTGHAAGPAGCPQGEARRNPGRRDLLLRTHVTQDRRIAGTPGRLDLTVSPHPVTIDPGVTIWTTFDTFTQSDIVDTDQSGQPELRLGTYNGGTVKARSYLTFDTSAFRGTRSPSAKLWLYETWSYSCTSRPWEVWSSLPVGTGTRWSNQPAPGEHLGIQLGRARARRGVQPELDRHQHPLTAAGLGRRQPGRRTVAEHFFGAADGAHLPN